MIKEKSNDESCHCYYKLILMDCYMPVMDGYEACKQLKELIQSDVIKRCNIVACTAAVTNDNLIAC